MLFTKPASRSFYNTLKFLFNILNQLVFSFSSTIVSYLGYNVTLKENFNKNRNWKVKQDF